ncbi:hypothetical protein B4U80_13855, partial [Leptotrombidium deliense]
IASASENKYSAEANAGKDGDSEFRMQKINLIWQKASRRLSGQKLKNLKTDLKLQDKEEITLKKLKYEKPDDYSVKESRLRMSLQEILDKYALSDLYDVPLESRNEL